MRKHALDNYETGGWDFLVECWEDADIEEAIGTATTLADALAAIAADLGVVDSVREEHRMEAALGAGDPIAEAMADYRFERDKT